MDPYSSISENLHKLEGIAGSFNQDALNDGEASHLEVRVQECLSAIHHELDASKDMPVADYNRLKTGFNNIDILYRKVFTDENETTFSAIKDAHQSYDALKTELEIKNKSPDLINSILNIKTVTQSYVKAKERDYLIFDLERNRFAGTNRPQEESRELHIRIALSTVQRHLKDIDGLLEDLSADLTEDEVSWVNYQLEGLREDVTLLYKESETVETEEFPSVFQYASEIFTKREASPEAEELDVLIDEIVGTLAASDFTNIEEMGKLAVGFHQFDPLLGSDEIQQIGRYLNDKLDLISNFIRWDEKTPSGEKSIYLRKEDTGLPRTLQVLLSEGGSNPEDLLFIVQLKRHGVMPLDEEGLKSFMQLVEEGMADPLKPSEKDLPILGKGGFKVAKHSLAFPFSALAEDGKVDREQVVHTTTLTPKIQSKEHIQQCLVKSEISIDTTLVKKTVAALGERGVENIIQDVKFHKMFQGPGVLPLIGSSRYEGDYKFEETSIIKSLFGYGRDCRVTFSKSNIVTIKCDGDLVFDPDKQFTLEEKKKIAEDIINGMIRIHEMGYRHGDMKPGNILFLRDEKGIHAFLCDFGESGSWNEDLVGGTEVYMPVDLMGFAKDSYRYDAYAMGLTLLGLLTNCHAYSPVRKLKEGPVLKAKVVLEDSKKLKAIAQAVGLPVEEIRKGFEQFVEESKDTYLLGHRDFIRGLFHDDSVVKNNPLMAAFIKTLFAHYSRFSKKMTEDERTRLLGSDSKIPLRGSDLTIPLLENLLVEIKKIKSEDDIDLSALINKAY